MRTILVDTSVWLEYFKKQSTSPKAQTLKNLIENGENVVLCPMIYQEILQGIKEENTFLEIQEILEDFEILKNDILSMTKRAISLYRFLRARGITIRKAYDCLIAAYALENDIPLLHNDKDFDQIQKYFPIKNLE